MNPTEGGSSRPSLGPQAIIAPDKRYSDRSCAPEDTIRRVAPCLAAHGITRVASLTGLDRIGIPVWAAVRPNARALSVYQGKGLTDAEARASATMEALERAVAEDPRIETHLATADELALRGITFDPLTELLGVRASVFDRSNAVAWTQATSLIDGGSIMVPIDAVKLDRTTDCDYWQSSDGLASGNTMEEAVFHGLLERIERDAEVLWKLKPPARRRQDCFDTAGLGDPFLNMLVDRIREADLEIAVFDMTSDNGIPAVSALVGSTCRSTERTLDHALVTGGSGAHPDPARATIRAVTEAVQSRLTLVSGARDDLCASFYAAPTQAILGDLAAPPSCAPPKGAIAADRDMGRQTAATIGALRSQGISRLHVVRLNPEETRFAVAKVVAPELENPQGERRHRFGRRAMVRLVRFR